MATRFQVGIPLGDINTNYVDTTSLQTNMETIAIDGLSHNIEQDTIYKSGVYQAQMNAFFWLIEDTQVTQATTYYNNFIAGYTFSINPYTHNWSVN